MGENSDTYVWVYVWCSCGGWESVYLVSTALTHVRISNMSTFIHQYWPYLAVVTQST